MNKEMSKVLEALERLYCAGRLDLDYVLNGEQNQDYKIIETALKRLEIYDKCNYQTTIYKDVLQISKELQAFEIIKDKKVNVEGFVFHLSLVDQLGEETVIDLCCGCSEKPLNREEFDLLKEVLK